jgi:hypothetical protein
VEFDELYRAHVANVYRALRLSPPEELSRPILKVAVSNVHTPPAGPLRPVIDGEVSSYFEWLGSGVYRVDLRSGAMHGKRFLIQQLSYGSDGLNVYLRVDFEAGAAADLAGMDAHLTVQPATGSSSYFAMKLHDGRIEPADPRLAEACDFAFRKVLEGRISLSAVGVGPGQTLRLQLSLWKDGLPVDALPQEGWLDISTAEPTDWPL